MSKPARWLALAVALALAVLAGAFLSGRPGGSAVALRILSGSENQTLEPIVQDWARANRVTVEVVYEGSVEISRELQRGAESGFDAVWPANSIWVELGDTGRVTEGCASILRSPVVLGLRASIARDLGWSGRDDITVQDIAAAAEAGRFRLAMTSATQSNSGASAYLGFLYALAGNPDVLTLDHLSDPTLREEVRNLLAQVDRSSGSSGWLRDALVANPDAYDAMINYESTVLEANQSLTAAGGEALTVIYPANGLAVADSPLCLIDRGDAARAESFAALQAHLLTPDVQAQIIAQGRRAGRLGVTVQGAPPPIWNPDWGVDPAREVASVPTPAAAVIAEALRLYQSELRKPSLTVWVLDVSGSMEGVPLDQLKEGMELLLDPEAAALNLLEPSDRDITIILPFSSHPQRPLTIVGRDPAAAERALVFVRNLQAGGGTDLYAALEAAFAALEPYHKSGALADHLPAVVAMTDGASDIAGRARALAAIAALPWGRDVPVHAVSFGEADEAQLEELNEATIGRLFDGEGDLAAALRSAKGYN